MRTDYWSELWDPIEGVNDIGRTLREGLALSPLGVKVTVEEGFVLPVFSLFTTEEFNTIKREASALGLPIFVHSQRNDAHRLALTMNPYALVHVGMGTETFENDVVEGIKKSGAYVISTLAVYEMGAWPWDRDALGQPWIESRVPIAQWQTAMNEGMRKRLIDRMSPMLAPAWAPTWAVRKVAPFLHDAAASREQLASSQRALITLYRAGVPIVMGADEGNWPVFTTFFHGVGSLLEMQFLEEAGLPRSEVIVAATSRAAKMLKQDDRIGTIRVGLDADLIVVPDNPLEHGMRSLQRLSWVIQRGVAKTPHAWLLD